MSHILVFFIILVGTAPIAFLWVRGLDRMMKYHPNYTGDDLFGLEDKTFEVKVKVAEIKKRKLKVVDND